MNPGGPAIDSIIKFIKSNDVWMYTYAKAWGIATTVNTMSTLTKIGTGTGLTKLKETMDEST